MYWEWKSSPDSRFSQVAELRHVWWLDIKGRMETRLLSPNTTYAVFLVFKFTDVIGFRDNPVELKVYFENQEDWEVSDQNNIAAILDPAENEPRDSRDRSDGWMEIQMGEFFNENGDDGAVVCKLWEHRAFQGGLVVEGIEFRPKSSSNMNDLV